MRERVLFFDLLRCVAAVAVIAIHVLAPYRNELGVIPFDQSKEQAIELGFPVALKLISPSIPSKSEVGGVVLNLNHAQEVELKLKKKLNTYQEQSLSAKHKNFIS